MYFGVFAGALVFIVLTGLCLLWRELDSLQKKHSYLCHRFDEQEKSLTGMSQTLLLSAKTHLRCIELIKLTKDFEQEQLQFDKSVYDYLSKD